MAWQSAIVVGDPQQSRIYKEREKGKKCNYV
jgi:hypothetical protein